MTKEEILNKHIDKESMDELSENIWPDMLDAMEEYKQQEVKSVDLADVVGQSEQLVCDHDWQSVFHHDNLIGRYCPECKELRAD